MFITSGKSGSGQHCSQCSSNTAYFKLHVNLSLLTKKILQNVALKPVKCEKYIRSYYSKPCVILDLTERMSLEDIKLLNFYIGKRIFLTEKCTLIARLNINNTFIPYLCYRQPYVK
ncbi:hypothetical protein OTU49_017225 [Cherax quadricarinatus]|uniref:Uncharacterized protein n=1 Tax=Cherax quadricarinatus TaxID=27406 RepID=A0AAW0XNC7_CHEQU